MRLWLSACTHQLDCTLSGRASARLPEGIWGMPVVPTTRPDQLYRESGDTTCASGPDSDGDVGADRP